MLMIWIFALSAGWANACLLQDRLTHSDPLFVVTGASPAVSLDHVHVLASHLANSATDDAPCLQVCGDTSHSLVKWEPDTEQSDMAMQPLFTMVWSESVVVIDDPHPARFGYPAQADRPLRTRYSRLTL